MQVIKGGLTAPKGFLASAVATGVKKSGRLDLALLYSRVPALCVGTFTTNSIKSGSVVLTKRRIGKGSAQAVIVNSGNANCCVGPKELKDAEDITESVAKKLGLKEDSVLIASTGIIGRPLAVGKIKGRINSLVKDLGRANGTKFATSIMTTDTIHKALAVKINIGAKKVIIGGAVKGAGMICPNMATMLGFFTTDALIEKSALRSAFKEAVAESFNKITVDGDTSTNDTAIILANGLSKGGCIKKGSRDYFEFLEALRFVAGELARKIVLDGEGATKFIEVIVKGAKSDQDAEKVARRIANSSLVKTMIAGSDPNWGRVAAAVGSSGIKVDQKKVDIYFGDRLVMKSGTGMGIPKESLKNIFEKDQIKILVELKSGKNSSRIWTCDLTKEYVEINSEYET